MAATYCLIGVLVLAVIASGQEVISVPGSDFLCPYCEKFVGIMKNYMTSPEALAEVEKLAELGCKFAPFEFNAECVAFAKELPGLVKSFADMYLDPKLACMEVCPAKELTANVEVKSVMFTSLAPLFGKFGSNDFSCVACEKVVGLLKNITVNAELLTTIETFLEDVCVLTPHIYYPECISFVKTIPEMVKLFAEEYLDPVKDCIDVCIAREHIVKNAPSALFKMFESMKIKN